MVRFIASAFLFFIISNAATLSWDFTAEEKITASEAPKVQHDFGELGKMTDKGFRFHINNKYHRISFNGFSEDPSHYPVVEILHRDGGALFSFAAYGDGESGYDDERLLVSEWSANERHYPERTSFVLKRMPRWQKGGIKTLQLIFSNSGEGLTSTIYGITFRRGVDTLENGALMIKEQDGRPAFWTFSDNMFANMEANCATGLPSCHVSAGTAVAKLDSLRPGMRYNASVYATAKCKSVFAVIFDRKGAALQELFFRKKAGIGDYSLFETDYCVDENAFRGEIRLLFDGDGAFSDAIVEELGHGGPDWHAQWIWAPGETRNGQFLYFRKEFDIPDISAVKEAFLQATCDDVLVMEVNNNRIFNSNTWSNPQHADVKPYLLKGRNVITAVGVNNTSYAGLLAELRLTAFDGSEHFIASDGTWLCRETPPGDNWRRVEPPEETKSGWQPSRVIGFPPVEPWGGKVRYYAEAPLQGELHPVDKSSFANRNTIARINHDMPFPRMEINGEIVNPMLFGLRPRGDAVESYKTAAASGFKIFRLGWEFSYEAWHSDGSIDYSGLEQKVEELLANIPDAKIILMFRISPPSFWTERHPDELIRFADGKTTGADGVFASPASRVFRKDAADVVSRLVQHIETSWYGSAIIGYMPCNLRGPEWVIPARHDCYPDYSEPMKRYFREYLRETYKTDAALQKAWGDKSVTIAHAELPREETRKPSEGYFLSNARQDVFDYNRAVSRANVDTIAAVLDAVHKNAPHKLRVLYFGYLMTMDHVSKLPSISGHYDLLRLLSMDKVDIMASPASYIWRKAGDTSSIGTVESSFAKHGVLWLQEADNRTYLSAESEEMRVNFHAATSLRENWREFICALLKRQAIWFYELGGGWYDHPYFHEDFRKMLEISEECQKTAVSWQTPMAYFFDEKCFDGVALSDGRWAENRPFCLAAECQRMAALCGIPYDIFELEDIYDLDLSKYKVLFFANTWRKNDKLARFLEKNVYGAGKTVVWLYAPGYGQKGGLAAMKALTGFTFSQMPMGTPLAFQTLQGRAVGAEGTKAAEVFCVAKDRDVHPMGMYADGSIAAAWKPQGRGRSVWMSTFDPTGDMLRETLVAADVVPLVKQRDRVLFDGRLLGVICVDGPGERNITIPNGFDGTVPEVITGKTFPCSKGHIKFDAAPGDVFLFRLND